MSAQQEAPTHNSLIIRVASKSNIKIRATELATREMFPDRSIQVLPSPVELQVQSDDVNAQPIGEAETARYARARLTALRSQHDDADAYIAIESGARPGELGLADACDFAIILIQNRNGS